MCAIHVNLPNVQATWIVTSWSARAPLDEPPKEIQQQLAESSAWPVKTEHNENKSLDAAEQEWNKGVTNGGCGNLSSPYGFHWQRLTASQRTIDMTLAIAISLFFGLVAALSLASCQASLRKALGHYRDIRAELTAMDRAHTRRTTPVRLRRPQDAYERALA